ncbi:MAG: hypothetical protein H6703_16510 [Myxococcales bacterium]|nr:hypothetical protein [Myxococcales bacterium]
MRRWLAGALIAMLSAACAEDVRDAPFIDESRRDPGEQREVEEPVEYRRRTDLDGYGLPRAGQPGLADLIALMPDDDIAAGASDIWAAPGDAPPCPHPGRVTILDDLPMTIEAVVTLHPRQYLKVPTCDQDERNYGSFVVEDDTGGIVVLRNSRVTPFVVGDRVKLTVRALMFTFRSPSTRVVLAADVERLEPPDGERHPVLFEDLDERFSLADITETRRISGVVIQRPDNTNFGSMTVASHVVEPPAEPAEPSVNCRETCPSTCTRNQCGAASSPQCRAICDAVCASGVSATAEIREAVPVCWAVGVDQELQRRGFGPAVGTMVEVFGPVFDSFNLQMWVQRLGQVRELDEQ